MNRRLATFLFLLLCAATPGMGSPARQVVVNLSGLKLEDGLDQSASSLPGQLEVAPAYTFSVNATAHGTGIFGILPQGTPLAAILALTNPASPPALAASVPNVSGTLPVSLVHYPFGGTISLLAVSATGVLDISIDATGVVTASLTRVAILVGGRHSNSDTVVLEPGSKALVIAVQPPTATSAPVTGVTMTGVVLSGFVNPQGAPATVTFRYGTDANYASTYALPALAGGLDPVSVSATLSGLAPGTVYHYAIQAANLTGTTQTADATFQAAPPPPPGSPAVSTGGATGITIDTATVGATVNANGSVTSLTFEYGPSVAYTATTPQIACGTGTSAIQQSTLLPGLDPGATYHYRAVASNTNGAVAGDDAIFQTLPGQAPAIFTGPATGVTFNGATVSALVNPHGQDTVVAFRYGVSGSYGSTIVAPDSTGPVDGQMMVTATLAGLQPGLLYHYVASGSNVAGVTSGVDDIFATPAVNFSTYRGRYTGLILPAAASFAASGLFTLTVAPGGAFTAAGKLGAKGVTFAGLFQKDGSAIANIGKSGLTVRLQLAGATPADGISGVVSGSASALVSALPALGAAAPAEYTIRLPHLSGTGLPAGNGFGSLKVSKSGAVTFRGTLGDGTAASFGAPLLSGSIFPVYDVLYHKTGGLVGYVSLASGSVPAGMLEWYGAFAAPVSFAGALYVPPARGQRAIGAASGSFVSYSGTTPVTISTGDAIASGAVVKGSIAAATGLFGGKIDVGGPKPVPFAGAIFQDTSTGAGLILTATGAQALDFVPRP